MNRQGEAVSFVARIWLEPGIEGERVWRGHIQHVQSGQAIYFHEPGSLVRFVESIAQSPFELWSGTGAGDASESHEDLT